MKEKEQGTSKAQNAADLQVAVKFEQTILKFNKKDWPKATAEKMDRVVKDTAGQG